MTPEIQGEIALVNCPILCGQYKKAPWQEILRQYRTEK